VQIIGRPYIYGLGAEGEVGVAKVVNIRQREFARAMVQHYLTQQGES
jgi:isopentenyl diphosphate isomerase/L-lactate dehydrogenase-like FMN-dependent dehydrogenase